MKKNKCPGSDGLSVEFYQTFWEEIKCYLHKSLSFAHEPEVLSTEQKRGIISLIPKKNTDRLSLHNWRPITLLNVDYKILTKALALRLKRIIPDIIFTDQTGYIAGRYIGTNLRTIEDIISYTDTTGEPGLLLALDFQKAFDSVSWSSIAEALKLYGFGDMYIRWVQTVYQDSETCVSNNGFTSMWFNPKRGTRQGCCLSPFLFILVLELLAIAIRTEEGIRGIHVGPKEIELTMLADDITLFLKDLQSLDIVLDFLKRFRRYSGLKINKEKSHVLPLSNNSGKQLNDLPIKGCNSMTILGIKVSNVKKTIMNGTTRVDWRSVKTYVMTGEIEHYHSRVKSPLSIVSSHQSCYTLPLQLLFPRESSWNSGK